MMVPEAQEQRHRLHNRPGGAPTAPPRRVPLRVLFQVASIAYGIQFRWDLHLSQLTSYVQELGTPPVWYNIVWLYGPLSGFLVQSLAGRRLSDHSTSKFGCRQPFIVIGAAVIIVSVLLIDYAADINGWFGGTKDQKTGAIVVFVIGFWLLDMANNVTHGPCRTLLAYLTGNDHQRKANKGK